MILQPEHPQPLRECPFCGGKASFHLVGDSKQSCVVICENCGCQLESSENRETSGALWNWRHNELPPSLRECGRCVALQAALDFVAERLGEERMHDADGIHYEAVNELVNELGSANARVLAVIAERDKAHKLAEDLINIANKRLCPVCDCSRSGMDCACGYPNHVPWGKK